MSEQSHQLPSRLSEDYSLFQSVEEAVRQGVILPVLAQLYWNTYNLREVVPEFKVGNGGVDHCLKIGEKKGRFSRNQTPNGGFRKRREPVIRILFC